MKIVWDWSLDSEAIRVLDMAHSTASGFFHLQHFLPLPWTPEVKYLPAGVYLPRLSYTDIPHFWTQVAKLPNHSYPLHAPPQLIAATRSLLLPLQLSRPDTTELELLASQLMPQISSFLHSLVPDAILPTVLTIHPTYFGAGGSFSLLDDSRLMTIFLRVDQGIRGLAECFLTSILRPPSYRDLRADWGQTEFLVDWLISTTSLTELLPPDPSWSGTIAATQGPVSPTIKKLSADFLRQIGAPTPNHQTFTLNDHQILFNKQVIPGLSARETTLLTKLIEKSPSPVTYDEIGCILFNCDEKFSLAAISKAIECLRRKLSERGISPSYLATASGVGYYLKT